MLWIKKEKDFLTKQALPRHFQAATTGNDKLRFFYNKRMTIMLRIAPFFLIILSGCEAFWGRIFHVGNYAPSHI